MQSLRNGTQLGAYTLIQLIARGGMGEVYEAHEVNLQRRVALKVIAPTNPDEHDHEELIRRFLQEARTLARVNHPNVVTIYAIDNVGDVPFIAMEYIEGVSFKELLKEFVLTSEAAAPLFEQMLEGVRCLHENRIVHRDLKPHNVLLRPDGQIKILDFGIAKHAAAGDYTRVGVVVGTLPYMAPELKSGAPATQQSDFWSLGAIFYECLVGTPLVLAMRDSGNPREIPYPSDCRVPPEMRAIVAKMCAPRAADRYQSAVQAIEDVKRFQQNRPQPTPEVWATLSQKIQAISEARRKKHSTGPVDLPTAEKFTTPIPADTRPISVAAPPKLAPIDIALGHDPTNPPPTKKRKKSRPATHYLFHEYSLAGIFLALVAGLFFSWPKSAEKPAPQAAAPLPSSAPSAAPAPAPAPKSHTTTVFRPPKEMLELKEPAAGQTLYLAPSAIPTLHWTTALDVDLYEIQISRDLEFKNLVVHEPVTGRSYRPARILPDGRYYWRLIPVNENQPPLPPFMFQVVQLTPAELEAPAPGAVVEVKSKKATTPVELAWNCKSYSATYRVQVAADEEFKKPIVDRSTSECRLDAGKLGVGSYHWRVRVIGKTRDQELWSESRKFAILPARAEAPALARVKVSTKPVSLTLAFKDSPRDPASALEKLTNPPALAWQPAKGAVRYLVQFSPARSFSPLFSEEVVKTPRLLWKNPAPGRVYWRVAALGAQSGQGPFSEAGQLDIKLPAPKLEPTYRFQVETKAPLTLEWDPVPFAHKYLVQIGKKRDLASATTKLLSEPKMKVSSQVGHQFIRVATVDASGEVTSDFSRVASVDVESALDAPKLLTPKPGLKVALRGSRISVVFTWSEIKGATSYSVEIASDPEFQNIIESRKSKDTTLLLKQAELKGAIYWRVRAKSAEGASAWSESGSFEVN